MSSTTSTTSIIVCSVPFFRNNEQQTTGSNTNQSSSIDQDIDLHRPVHLGDTLDIEDHHYCYHYIPLQN